MSLPPSRSGFELDLVVAGLREARERWRGAHDRLRELGGRELPSPGALAEVIEGLRAALFPMRLGPPDLRQESEDYFVGNTLDAALHTLVAQVRLELRHQRPRHERDTAELESRAVELVRQFAAALPAIRSLLDGDVQAAFHGDPAAGSVDEVLLCYPGIEAMIRHRLAHKLHELGAPLVARIVAEHAHGLTGIDIHPGARIGAGFFIDHGTGVVIGETAVVGERVRVYQAVTLGAKRFPKDAEGHLQKALPRHPVVEDDVVVYAGATILGRITVGARSTIGGNVWLTHSVPPDSQITQADTRQIESVR